MNHKRARPRKQRAGSVGRPGSREGNGKERVPVADRCRVLDDLHDYIGDAMDQFEQNQRALGSALSRLLVVVERYPDLKSNQNFLALQSQLEGTENRITVERMRFNEMAQKYNTMRRSLRNIIVANLLGFREKAYFQAETGAAKAPAVKF